MSARKRGMPYGEPIADGAVQTSRLVRCACAQVYDSLVTPSCPTCGALPPVPSAVSPDSKPESVLGDSLQPDMCDWVWKAVAGAIALLLFVTVVKDIRACNQPTGHSVLHSGKSSQRAAREFASDGAPPALQPSDFEERTPEPKQHSVDSRLVGIWTAQISTNDGPRSAELSIEPESRYSFVLPSPKGTWKHSGVFYTDGGAYRMEQQPEAPGSKVWKDSGPYTVHSPSSFSTNGALKVTWSKQPPATAPQRKGKWPLQKLWGGSDYWNDSRFRRGARR